MKKNHLIITLFFSLLLLNGCATSSNAENTKEEIASQATTTPTSEAAPATTPMVSSLSKNSNSSNWQTLSHTPLASLQQAEASSQDPNNKGWLSLAIIAKQDSTNAAELINHLKTWRAENPEHPANELIPDTSTLDQLLSQPKPKHIALLLPLKGSLSSSGQAVRNGFLAAYYDNLKQGQEKQALSFYDSNENKDLAALYQKAKEEGADLVIGPLSKAQVEAMHGLANFDVPVLALNYTQTSFFKSMPSNFYEFGLSPTAEATQLAHQAHHSGLKTALIISSKDTWGYRVTEALKSEWQSEGGTVSDSLYFNSQTNLTQEIAQLLHINPKADRALMHKENNKSALANQRRQDFDVIFIFAQPDMGRQIVPLLRFYYADNVPLYSISAIYSGRPNPAKDKDLNGITFCETPWLIQQAHQPSDSPEQFDRLYALGRDAYVLSQSLPRANTLSNFPIYGTTGALSMEQQQVHQRLPWVTMHNGQI